MAGGKVSALHRLARAAGLQIDWTDAAGERQRVSNDSLVAVLEALGLSAGSERQIRESLEGLSEEEGSGFITADAGVPFSLPGAGERTIDEPGYHEIGGTVVAVAPARAFTIADAAPGQRIWGPAVQIPSLRDHRAEPYGDFGALATLVEKAAGAGADAVAMSPVHALFPGDPNSFSPYGPSTRLFLNVLLADPSLLGDKGAREPGGELIDWESAIPARMERLRMLYERRSDQVRREVEEFAREKGEPLRRHALFDALFARFRTGWPDWPAEFQDPSAPGVANFAREQADEVDFYLFLQWLADRSLACAHKAAQDGGMAVGLIADMAVGMSHGGSQAWSRREGLLTGLSVGAPPDLLGPQGQDWGITTFSPRGLRQTGYRDFIDTIRAAVEHAGGIRIDHAMSLKRLWVVPHGASSRDGVYLHYPQRDLMRLLALESRRARAIVVGEDLGTVPAGFREAMADRGFMGMRVLWFERTRSGGFRVPERYEQASAAMTSTHDLPTVAGWWSGRDIDWNRKLGRSDPDESETEERARRQKERRLFVRTCRRAGIDTADPVGAALEYVASAPSDLALLPAEDLLGVEEQPNLPGTIDEHPNWRRRLPVAAEDMFETAAERVGRIKRARRR
jgi:4-alpha-glucanotransferase